MDARPGTALQRIRAEARPPSLPPRSLPPPSDWKQYVEVVRHHRWLVLLVTIAGALVGVLLAGWVKPQYEARVVLWVESGDGDRVGAPAAPTQGQLLDAASTRKLITSNAVLDSVVRAERLYLRLRSKADRTVLADFRASARVKAGGYVVSLSDDAARYTLTREDEGDVETGAAGDSIGRGVGFMWAPTPAALAAAGGPIRFDVDAPYDVTSALAQRVVIEVEPNVRFVRLVLTGPDPEAVTRTLNAIADRSVLVAAGLKKGRLEELETILGGRYRHAQDELRAAESALAGYQTGTVRRLETSGAASTAAPGASITALTTLSSEAEEIARDRVMLQRIVTEAGAGPLDLDALASVPAVTKSARLQLAMEEARRRESELRTLRYRYSVESAPVVEATAALTSLTVHAIPDLTKSLVADLTRREGALAPRVDAVFGRLRSAPGVAITEARLERDLRGAEQMFSQVGERYEGNRLALLSSLPELHVLDRAIEPQSPVSNLAPLVIVLATVASFGLGIMGVRVRDHLDSRIRRPEQVTHDMRLTILGCVPRVSGGNAVSGNGRSVAVASEVRESFRGLRVRLLQARANGPLCFTVTSPAAGEGKSYLSLQLALSFAQAGYRTVLVDGDVRRGSQARALDVPARPGLVDLLGAEATLDEVLRPTKHAGLSLVPAGVRSASAPELLLGARLDATIAALHTTHDIIIVDSPPLSAGVDALVLGAATTNLLLVLRSGVSDLPLTLARLDAADAYPINVIGAVLNDVRGHGAFRYYTYDLNGDETAQEPETVTAGSSRMFGGKH